MKTLDNLDIEMKCPNCKKTIVVNSSNIGKTVQCKFCRTNIKLEDNGFTDSKNKANKSIRDFEKSLKKLFK